MVLRVTVLRGGPSGEREVSLAGGAAVAAACRRLGFKVNESDIAPDDLRGLDSPADVIFPVLHGEFGEDGRLQAILEERGFAYVGSDAASSRIAIDKDASKRKWQSQGLPTAAWAVIDQSMDPDAADLPATAHGAGREGDRSMFSGKVSLAKEDPLAEKWTSPRPPRERLHLPEPPVVLKPLCEGSSIGVRFCTTVENLRDSVRQAVREYGRVLVEKQLHGPELTVGVLENRALPIIEIRPNSAFYTYEAKYRRDDTQYLFEPAIDAGTYSLAQKMAVEAFQALGCRDYGRVDFIADRQSGLHLLEINTIPGFTDHSLLPKAAARAGIGFDDLVGRLVRLAHERGRQS